MSADVCVTGLDRLLESAEPAGVAETRALLASLLRPGREAALVEERSIWRARVHRARFRVDGTERSFILKRLPLDRAHREQLAVRRWLPQLDLAAHGSPLLGVAAAPRAECIWHVYQDLGPHTLDKLAPDPAHIEAAVRLLAQLHTRAAASAFLGECREFGVELGERFLVTGIADALRVLEGVEKRHADLTTAESALVASLLQRLRHIRTEAKERTQLLVEHGGPETLLHGDLWTCNIFVLPKSDAASTTWAAATPAAAPPACIDAPEPFHVRFIDWDHAGVGYASYDLSALLLRFPARQRDAVLDAYAAALAPLGWRLPARHVLNTLFETAELARLVSAVLWPALAFHDSRPDWAIARLAEVDGWFDEVQPVLVGEA